MSSRGKDSPRVDAVQDCGRMTGKQEAIELLLVCRQLGNFRVVTSKSQCVRLRMGLRYPLNCPCA